MMFFDGVHPDAEFHGRPGHAAGSPRPFPGCQQDADPARGQRQGYRHDPVQLRARHCLPALRMGSGGIKYIREMAKYSRVPGAEPAVRPVPSDAGAGGFNDDPGIFWTDGDKRP